MPFRRHSAKSMKRSRACQAACEPLERRQMLTALVNGTFQGTGTQWDGRTYFEYMQANGNALVRISVRGNITAEFIGGRWDPSLPNQVRTTDLIPATATTSDVFLFSIYVVKADMDSTISIAVVPSLTTTPRPMDPFSGSNLLRYFNATSGASETVTLDDGGVYIGVRTPSDLPPDANEIPHLQGDRRAFGMRPSSAGEMWAGLEVAPGNDLGRFFLGGAITGLVDVPGSMETFYAGTILTGNAQGIADLGTTSLNKNFHIGKDIRNLLTANSFGAFSLSADPNAVAYKTGFKLDVTGRVGQVRAWDSFLGQASIHNDARVKGPGIAQREIEIRGEALSGDASYFDPRFRNSNVAIGMYSPDPRFNNNDTFDTAQYLGTAWNQTLNTTEAIQLTGALNNLGDGDDNVDFYAVPLLAGQTFEVQLLDDFVGRDTSSHLRVGIFDPDDRLIASDYSNIKTGTRINKTLRITADRPGSYRIAIADNGDFNFNGAVDTGESVSVLIPNRYQLRVRKVADIALGGLIVENHIATMDLNDKGIEVLRGDLGEVRAGLVGGGIVYSYSEPWYLPSGNFRAFEASEMGVPEISLSVNGSGRFNGPDFFVRKGSLGLLRTTSAAGEMIVNDDSDTYFPASTDDLSLTRRTSAVGNNIQLVDAAGNLDGALLSNGAIGMIRAGSVGVRSINGTPVWMANVDRSGSDGIIDLIDVSGELRGPAISTGPNGNVRYMHVAGGVSRDPFFGGGSPEPTQYAAGVKARLTDDSGTQVILTPLPLVRNDAFGPDQPPFVDPASLSVLTYPIRDKAGVAILNVTVAPGATGGGGLQVDTGSRGPLGGVEFGEIDISGSGPALTFDPFNRLYTIVEPTPTDPNAPPTEQRTLDLLFRGPSTIDVWSIVATAPAVTFSSIVNQTDGEIVNVGGNLPSINLIEAETIGLAKSHTRAAVNGIAVLDSTYPFRQQRNLIQVADLNSANSRRGIGNILANNINSIRANSDRRNVSSVFEGINAPIVVRQPTAGPTAENGNIVSVQIGEGVLSSGSGDAGLSGIYADGIIDSVTGSGKGVDIRGDIVASGITTATSQTDTDPDTGITTTLSTPTFVIGNIRLVNGSIVDADVLTTPVDQSREGERSLSLSHHAPDTFDEPIPDIQSIRLDGIGGVLGTYIGAYNIGLIQVNGGFGVLNSQLVSSGTGNVAGIVTDGYGVRDTLINGGADLQRINARGKGKRVATTYYSSSVRFSEKSNFDPYSGESIDALNDLHTYLGTSAARPKIKGISDAGLIQDCQFLGSRELGRIDAYRIIGRNVLTTDSAGNKVKIPLGSQAYPMRVAFGNATDTIRTTDIINGLSLTTGGISLFNPGADVQNAVLNVAGRVESIAAGGALRGTTSINVTGPEGQIDSITIRRSLYAKVNASQDIITARVGTDLGSPIFNTSRNLRTLTVNGSILSGANVRVRKTLFNLIVGRDLKAGATVTAHAINNQQIKGQILGDLIIR